MRRVHVTPGVWAELWLYPVFACPCGFMLRLVSYLVRLCPGYKAMHGFCIWKARRGIHEFRATPLGIEFLLWEASFSGLGIVHWKQLCRQAHIEGSLCPQGDAGTCFDLTWLLLPAAEGSV